jgi:hypothetical protein
MLRLLSFSPRTNTMPLRESFWNPGGRGYPALAVIHQRS